MRLFKMDSYNMFRADHMKQVATTYVASHLLRLIFHIIPADMDWITKL